MLFTGLVLSNCATVKLKDAEVFSDLGPYGAHANWLFHDAPRDLILPDWDHERVSMICTKVENFLDWQSDIQKLCAISHRCTREDVESLDAFFLRIKTISTETNSLQSQF
jgi:hypothetical protein